MVLKRAVIDPAKCDKSPWCPAKRVCPVKAIERENERDPYFVNTACLGCGACLANCPGRAISME